jgi:hypothetical protein
VAGKPWWAVSKDFPDIYGVTVGPAADAGPPTEGSPRRKRNQRGDRHPPRPFALTSRYRFLNARFTRFLILISPPVANVSK